MNTQHIDLDVSKSPTMPQHVRIGQGDSSGTTIVATIYDNGVAATLAGMSARFCMRLPGGRQYVRDSDCTVSGSNITYVVDEEHCAAVRGRTDEAYFEILAAGSVVYSTNRFTVHVLRGVTDGAVPGETYDTEIERAIQRANDAAEAAEEAAGGVTPLMGENTRGGAMLGDGLALTDEKLGVDPLTTAQIDTVVADGSLTSNKVLTGTRLTYLWSKLKQKFASLVNGAVAVSQGGTGGTTALDARKNLAVPVDSSIAYVESTTAQANHAVGDYFMLGSVLMRATAAIAAGETINASKATPATLQGQIDTLRDSVSFRNITSSVSITPSSDVESITPYIYQYGKVRRVTFSFSLQSAKSGTISIAKTGLNEFIGTLGVALGFNNSADPLIGICSMTWDNDGELKVFFSQPVKTGTAHITTIDY